MKKLIALAAVMTAMSSTTAAAQTAAHEVKAREIYARVISFRTAAGQKQTPEMVAYLIDVLKPAAYRKRTSRRWTKRASVRSSCDCLGESKDDPSCSRRTWMSSMRAARNGSAVPSN